MIMLCKMPRSTMTGSYGSSTFSFIRNVHVDFHSCCTRFYPHQAVCKGSSFLTSSVAFPNYHLFSLQSKGNRTLNNRGITPSDFTVRSDEIWMSGEGTKNYPKDFRLCSSGFHFKAWTTSIGVSWKFAGYGESITSLTLTPDFSKQNWHLRKIPSSFLFI